MRHALALTLLLCMHDAFAQDHSRHQHPSTPPASPPAATVDEHAQHRGNDAVESTANDYRPPALTDADRAKAYGQVQEIVMNEHLWIPVMNVKMYQTSNKKLKGARAHMLFQYTHYKGLDLSY